MCKHEWIIVSTSGRVKIGDPSGEERWIMAGWIFAQCLQCGLYLEEKDIREALEAYDWGECVPTEVENGGDWRPLGRSDLCGGAAACGVDE